MNIIELKTIGEYETFVASKPAAVVHFGAKWNSFDRMMLRNLIELEPEFAASVAFGFIDIDCGDTAELMLRVNLVNVPTLVYFHHGAQVFVSVGMKPQDEIREQILRFL